MLYILTQEELDELKKTKKETINLAKTKLQKLCTKICNEMPVKTWKSEIEPWGCILSKKYEWYCDQCPVQEICPCTNKHYSQ